MALFDWEEDLQRFEREVRSAEAQGRTDPLSLAEMECSLDLMENDLRSLTAARDATRGSADQCQRLAGLRDKLAALIARSTPLLPEY
jgi:hypothetical protein